jgi:hypothetical protein
MTENTLLDLDNMLNDTLDAIPDAPDFTNPPAGEYRLQVKDAAIDKYKTKDDPNTERQRLKITYSILETISTASNEQPVPDGSLFTETFMATEQGLGYFKKRIKEVMGASDVAGVTLSDMMNSVKGTDFNARITIKKSVSNGKEYGNVQIRVVK